MWFEIWKGKKVLQKADWNPGRSRQSVYYIYNTITWADDC